MRKHLIVAVIICTVFIWLTACGERAVKTSEDQIGTDENINVEEIILQEDSHFIVVDLGDYEYYYAIYNSYGETVKEGNTSGREPAISYIHDGLIQIFISAGLNVFYCTYYDILHDRFSESYESPLAAEYGKVAYLDWSAAAGEAVLVVEDLFEENGYHEEFYLDIPKVVTAVTDAIFLDDNFFCILYRSQDLQEDKLSIVDLRDGTVMTGFSQVVYPIDQKLYDAETEREYKEAFYATITNQAVMDYQGGRAVYFRDYFQGLKDLNDLSYLFLDCDGDGLPELVMGGFSETKGLYSDGYCVLKYAPEEERVIFSYHIYSGYMPLGSSQWGSNRKNSKEECYTYQAMDAQGVEEADIYFEHTDLNGEARYYMRVGQTGFYIEQAQWQAFSKVLKASLEHPLEMVSFAEAFGEGFSTEMPDDEEDHNQWLFEYWTDFREEWDLPYADEKTFEQVKKAYAEVDFFGKFEKGDVSVYDEYITKYYELLQNNMPVYDSETDMYVPVMEYDDFGWYYKDYGQTNFEYFLFDIDGDKLPEIAIQTYGHGYYVFDYNADTEEYSVWYPMGGIWYRIIGTRKVQWAGEGRYLAFYQLDESGEEECETFIFSRYKNEEIYLCMAMLPKYADSSKEIAVTEEMKNQGVYEKSSGQWYFRITQEQFDELSKEYVEAHKLAMKQREEVSYTYEELFGSFSTSEIQMYNEFLSGERCIGGADIYDYITPTGEPDRRYATDYIILDSTGDGIPELHLRTAREYTILSCVDGEIVVIQSFFSSPWRYNLTDKGAFIIREDIGTTMGDFYLYFEMDKSGNFTNEVTFEWTDINENLICDEKDEFIYNNRSCTKEEWYEQTKEYLYIDEEGRYQIREQVEWIRYCE